MSEWDQRQLCPDGACVGVIGDGGRCSVCGRVAPNWGDERRRGLDEAQADHEVDDAAGGTDDPLDPIQPSAPAAIGVWRERMLCPNGACIGVIGEDGTCKVCGSVGQATDDEDEYEDDEDDEGDEHDEADEDEATADEDDLPESCPDGACIGVIGEDGKCKVCGKEAA